MIRNRESVANHQGTLAKKKEGKVWPERVCRICASTFSPRSGMAAKMRTYCYAVPCEEQAHLDRTEVQRRRAQARRERRP